MAQPIILLDMIRDLCGEAAKAWEDRDFDRALVLARTAEVNCREGLSSGHFAYPMCLMTWAWCARQVLATGGAAGAIEGVAPDPAAGAERAWVLARGLSEEYFDSVYPVYFHAAQFFAEENRHDAAAEVLTALTAAAGNWLGEAHPRVFMYSAAAAAARRGERWQQYGAWPGTRF